MVSDGIIVLRAIEIKSLELKRSVTQILHQIVFTANAALGL